MGEEYCENKEEEYEDEDDKRRKEVRCVYFPSPSSSSSSLLDFEIGSLVQIWGHVQSYKFLILKKKR